MPAPRSDIVFVFPPSQNAGAFASHLGAAYLRATLARCGISSVQYLNANPGTLGEVARELLALRPRITGFTAYDANFPLCLALSRILKQREPGMKIVFGGPSVTFGAKELMSRHEVIDVCMLSEAEETAPQVLGQLGNGILPDQSEEGVAFRRDGEVICTGNAPLTGANSRSMQSALDLTPSPYLSGMLQDGRTGLLTGRGCTHNCQYCCFAALGRKKVRLHSLERVLAELEFIGAHQQRTGERYLVPVHDDTFTLLPARAKTLCEMMIGRGLKLRLSCVTRADTVDEELLRLMRRAGFVSLAFGLESAVPSVLRAAGKVRPPNWPDQSLDPERRFIEQLRQSVVSAKRLGFTVGVSIILGLPGETAADGKATLRFVRTLPVDYYAHNLLDLSRGTPLWQTHAAYGIQCGADELGLPTTTGYAYDVRGLRPAPKSVQESEAGHARTAAADALWDCEASSQGDSIGTVIIAAPELSATTADWLREVLAIGGTVVQVYPRLTPAQRKEQIERDRATLAARMVPTRDYIQLQRKRTRKGEDRYVLACSDSDLFCKHKPSLASFTVTSGPASAFAWLAGRETSCELCDASAALLRSSALARLARQLKTEDGLSRLQRMPIPPRLGYAGRWLKRTVSCRPLSRLEVDSEGNVRCCRFGSPIGKVGDKKKDLKRRLSEYTRSAEHRRRCGDCSRTECPRCPFPGISDKAYCSTVAQGAPALAAVRKIWLYSRLPSMLAGMGQV